MQHWIFAMFESMFGSDRRPPILTIYEQQERRKRYEELYAPKWDADKLRKQNPT